MSKQLSVASAFSVFALSALALFGPAQTGTAGESNDKGATIELAAPSFSVALPLID